MYISMSGVIEPKSYYVLQLCNAGVVSGLWQLEFKIVHALHIPAVREQSNVVSHSHFWHSSK